VMLQRERENVLCLDSKELYALEPDDHVGREVARVAELPGDLSELRDVGRDGCQGG
jgi:hypothetical protein